MHLQSARRTQPCRAASNLPRESRSEPGDHQPKGRSRAYKRRAAQHHRLQWGTVRSMLETIPPFRSMGRDREPLPMLVPSRPGTMRQRPIVTPVPQGPQRLAAKKPAPLEGVIGMPRVEHESSSGPLQSREDASLLRPKPSARCCVKVPIVVKRCSRCRNQNIPHRLKKCKDFGKLVLSPAYCRRGGCH